MDELYNMLSSGARINKKKKKKTDVKAAAATSAPPAPSSVIDTTSRRGDERSSDNNGNAATTWKRKRDRGDDHSSSSSSSSDYDSDCSSADDERARRKHNRHEEHRRQRIHREEVAAFRNRMKIRIGKPNRAEGANCPDPVSSFHEIKIPPWWKRGGTAAAGAAAGGAAGGAVCPTTREFDGVKRAILSNVERGKWTEPTPIQMQCVPALLRRRDVIGAAPTGSGKTGAFVIPALFLVSAPPEMFYGTASAPGGSGKMQQRGGGGPSEKSEKKRKGRDQLGRRGEIRTLLLAPSRELAAQLHREVERLGQGKRGGLRSALLSKANSRLIIEGKMGGKRGLDVLVATPLRLCECLNGEGGGSSGVDLSGVRMVVLDEADRLLDASDGGGGGSGRGRDRDEAERRERTDDALENGAPSGDNGKGSGSDSHRDDGNGSSSSDGSNSGDEVESSSGSSSSNDDESNGDETQQKGPHSAKNKHKKSHPARTRQQDRKPQPLERQSGSAHAKTFLEQIDHILSACPPAATRALFSATVGPRVRSLAESILRNPVDVTITTTLQGANPDIEQKLTFVGREEGKLLAIRQLIQRGEIKPPVLVFLQSKERAQALFGELLYDGVNVDVLHAGRSRAARDESVAKFRKGDTWVLICTDLVARGVDFKAVNMVINYDLPATGVSYVHRIGRCGRAGRKGTAVTLFTENDFENLRTVANVMRLSGCEVPDWMLTLKKKRTDGRAKKNHQSNPRRTRIDTVPSYDRMKKAKRIKSIENSKSKKKAPQRNDQGEA